MQRKKVKARLVKGQHLVGKEGGGFRQLAIGEVIEINADQYAHLRNKFQLVDAEDEAAKAAPQTPMNPKMVGNEDSSSDEKKEETPKAGSGSAPTSTTGTTKTTDGSTS